MALDLIRTIAHIESSEDYHCMRILILLSKSRKDRIPKAIDGLSKLAKMDFFMQYPGCLKKASNHFKRVAGINVIKPEANSIGSKMYYFKYSPWDSRYRKWISLLQARDLVITHTKGNTVYVEITHAGLGLTTNLGDVDVFKMWQTNSDAVIKMFSGMSGIKISGFISEHFPEINDLKSGEEFSL